MTVMLRREVPLLLCTSCGQRYRRDRGHAGCPRCGCATWVAAWVARPGYAREM